MTYEDFKLIDEISNSEFPLMDIVNAFSTLNHNGRLQDVDYEVIQDDLVKIAKTFKDYYDYKIFNEVWEDDPDL